MDNTRKSNLNGYISTDLDYEIIKFWISYILYFATDNERKHFINLLGTYPIGLYIYWLADIFISWLKFNTFFTSP